ncbi:Hemerythrin HHE cation binding domain-containing protein [Andreprevotia lacus DSM 23236]|jgi:hypothetical protein|uniref:Hemerythrin HHE cation binding domain-containing protein n=1 Tax=Andreprevotia lacus DSM 23236 TaxID=1121001 RepID=A0A1W1XWU9_9NEIS|nr:hemerythrin domain-containing protein [Andreprevotia lacus]SMC28460.1 Hemerythrin HHE cation binding domain-containing protein [Andreprevotia lacus DSM 23236]
MWPSDDASFPRFDEPVGMLTACHDKVRRFAALGLKLETHLAEHGADGQAAGAAEQILRYFDIAAPLHHADEEEDLFPALRALDDAQLHAALSRIEAEHVALAALWQAVRSWLLAVVAGQVLPAPNALSEFARAYPAHAADEEALLYPAAARLAPEVLAQIGQRMQARRGAA